MAAVDQISPWHSFRLRIDPAGDPKVGAYGGHPRGVRARDWPRCAVCGAPMCHMAQLDAGSWLDLQGYARMTVFICHATGGRCEDWEPFKGANHVMLHRELDNNLYDGPPTVRVYRRRALRSDPPVDERARVEQARQRGEPMDRVLASLKHDKLGGGAIWLQGDEAPPASNGQGPMRLVLQMTTDLVAFDITPGGMAYVFVDPGSDAPVGRLLWQAG